MDNQAHRPGGMGSPAQGAVGASYRACGDVEPGTPAWGDGESCPGGGRSASLGLWGPEGLILVDKVPCGPTGKPQ